jgi:DNA-binding PadR family transcriptional regulator
MMVKTLHAMGPLHGFGIARRLEHVSEHVLQLNDGTVYTSLGSDVRRDRPCAAAGE